MKREKGTGPITDPCGTPRRTRKERLFDFEKPHKRAYQKGKIESNEQSKKEKGGMSNRVKSFREIDSRKDRPRARPGLVNPSEMD